MGVRGIQCRAARALLGLSQRELAEAAHIGLRLLVDFEKEARSLTPSGMIALEKTLTDLGIILIEENGWVGVKIRQHVDGAAPAGRR
jgi:transcriptional regulator with XRE-family HTH domain